ncbi:MAG TPA: SDR family oxidoreductase [Staphylococcus kloosii]|uniref:Diacetyl reductase [(S)-acetoin forming] n=1 Tax=Staphylococcus kloosii TaxID=29384 RepID=A0A921H1M4_9STAP|nr:SDR family oxidoreductase [Staphylococcus kloosii]HJF68358.1 SDR family oxidoreductase [Staphylococcus kloosii]
MKRKVALITGSAKGLGKKTAFDLAEAGIDVVINYKTSKDAAQYTVEKINTLYDVNAIAVQADVSDPNEVDRMVQYIMSTMGSIDILIHNAGPFIAEKLKITDISFEQWDLMINGNFKSFFNLVKCIVPIMRNNAWGRVITIGFDQVHTLPAWTYRGVYAAAKTGTMSLTKTLAKEEASYNITFNAVSPGDISEQNKDKDINYETTNGNFKQHEIQREEYGEDISRVIKFLCEEDSGYITGAIIPITGNHNIVNKHDK